jgi:hypothetical protein
MNNPWAYKFIEKRWNRNIDFWGNKRVIAPCGAKEGR